MLVGGLVGGMAWAGCSSATNSPVEDVVLLDAGVRVGLGAPDATTLDADPGDAGELAEAQPDARASQDSATSLPTTDASLDADVPSDASADAPPDAPAAIDAEVDAAADTETDAGSDDAGPGDAAVALDANEIAATRCVKGVPNGAFPTECQANPWGCLYEEDGGIPQTACGPTVFFTSYVIGVLADGEEVDVGPKGNGLLECCAVGVSPY